MISYAGVNLCDVDDATSAWVTKHTDPSWSWVFEERTFWPGQSLVSYGNRPPAPVGPLEPGTLEWPWGACRFAVGHFLATDPQLATIRQTVYPGGTGYASAPLVLDDGVGSVTATLYLLPPRPLTYPQDTEQLWLLTLVDQRYFWWFKAATVAVSAGSTTWAQLYSSIGTALGVTITPDTISASYLKPPSAFAVNYQALPILLDAVALSVGQRVVCGLDGTVTTQNALTAKASVDSQFAALSQPQAGGSFNFSPL